MRTVIAGSTGFIGRALGELLRAEGHQITPLVRRTAGAGEIAWNPDKGEIDGPALEGIDVVINLAGESITGRWTREKKQRIRDSRLNGTRLLASALSKLASPPRTFLCASAVGIYGDRGDETLTESSAAGTGFLAELGTEWEREANRAAESGIRVVNLRFGVVLDREGGALEAMLRPFRLGVGGVLGSGRQYMSWITREDTARAIAHTLRSELSGPVNIVAPAPSTNRDFTRSLAAAVRRPAIIPVPGFALRALFGEMADEALLSSARVIPQALLADRFEFKHPDLATALQNALQ